MPLRNGQLLARVIEAGILKIPSEQKKERKRKKATRTHFDCQEHHEDR
jgi:hypothetical protein